MATSAHPADDDRIFFKEARSLAHAGAHVTILCAKGREFPADALGVRFANYSGGGRLRQRTLSIGALESALAEGSFDVIHCHEPDSLLASLRVKRKSGVRVIFDSHEMCSSVVAGRFPRPFWEPVMAAYRLLEHRWIAQCDGAIGASWAISDYLSGIIGQERVATILNVPVVEVFGESQDREWGDMTLLCHDGHLNFNRGLKTMAEAVRIVSSSHHVVFRIVGDVFGESQAWLDRFVAMHRLEDVIVRTGWLPYGEVGKALAPCHIGLIALQRTPNNIVTSSNKVFNYMLYGIPFIGPHFRLSKRRLVEEEQCGVLADSRNPESYAGAISGMIKDRTGTLRMSHHALNASKTKYRWEHMEPILFGLYETVAGLGPRRGKNLAVGTLDSGDSPTLRVSAH